jgi:hypothetical protein
VVLRHSGASLTASLTLLGRVRGPHRPGTFLLTLEGIHSRPVESGATGSYGMTEGASLVGVAITSTPDSLTGFEVPLR